MSDEDPTDGITAVKEYKVGKVLGKGSYGTLRLGKNTVSKEEVAMKFELLTGNDSPQLAFEYAIYRKFGNKTAGIPKLHLFAKVNVDYHVLIMELLGQSLESLFDKCKRQFSVQTVVQIAVQLVERIEYIHSKFIINRDIKPDNFLIGPKGTPQAKIIYIIDFGLAKEYIENDHHISKAENTSFLGTVRYSSRNSHQKITLSRRDDLEAIGYILVYFLKGDLPWQGQKGSEKEKFAKIAKIKMDTTPAQLCNGLPPCFTKYVDYVQNLAFNESPDYSYLTKLFKGCMKDRGLDPHAKVADYRYDWDGNVDSGINVDIGREVRSNARVKRTRHDD